MRVTWPLLSCILASTALLSCGPTAPAEADLPRLDRRVFRESVQPVLAARCANPSTCHGREDRPLALYVRGANRANPRDVFRDPPLTEHELDANYERARCFAVSAHAGEPELLAKPLAEALSGVWHRGGDIFFDARDREYLLLENWITRSEPEETP